MSLSQAIDRRKALTVVASVPAAIALASTAAALAPEDVELLQLWEEWKEQFAKVGATWKAEDEASAKANEDSGPIWRVIDFKIRPSRAFFLSSWADDDRIKIVRLKTKSFDKAQDEARKVEASLKADRHAKRIAADRKHRVASFKRAYDSASRKLDQIEAAIAEAPATSILGVVVKLALWCAKNPDESNEPENELPLAAYSGAVKLAGCNDLAAQVKSWSDA